MKTVILELFKKEIIINILLSLLFLTHIMLCERYKNVYQEYDVIYINSISLLILIYYSLMFCFKKEICISYNRVSIYFIFILLIIAYHTLFLNNIDKYIFFTSISFFILYQSFLNKQKNNILLKAYIYSNIILSIYMYIDVDLFEILQKSNVKINSGENSNYIACTIAFTLCIFLHSKNLWFKLFCFLSIGFNYIVLFASGSRTAIISSFITILLIFIAKDSKFFTDLLKRNATILIISLLISALVIILIVRVNTASIYGRLLIYNVSINKMLYNPLLGIGVNRYKDLYNNNQADFFKETNSPFDIYSLADDNFYCFNEFLRILIEYGVVGLFIIISIIYVTFINYKNNLENHNYLSKGSFFSLISIASCCLASYPLESTSILVMLSFFLSLIKDKYDKKLIIVATYKQKYVFLSIIMIYAFTNFYHMSIRVTARTSWEKGAYLAKIGNFSTADVEYKRAFDHLKDNGDYLYNYGAEAYIAGQCYKGLFLLKKSQSLISHTSLYIYLSSAYECTGNISNAEKYLKYSSYIVPAKLFPRHLLLLLYIKKRLYTKAVTVAKQIVTSKVKINSRKAQNIKLFSKKFLIKQSVYEENP